MIAELFDVLVDVSFAEVWSVLVFKDREGQGVVRAETAAPVVVGQR